MIYGGILEFITMFRDEQFHDRWRMIMIHFSSILGGAFGVGWQTRFTGHKAIVIGASGGTYGMLASLIGSLFLNWNELSFIRRFMYLTTLLSACLTDIIVNIIYPGSNVSYSAHVGGFIYGTMSAVIFIKNSVVYKYEKIVRNIMWCLFVSISITSVVIMVTL